MHPNTVLAILQLKGIITQAEAVKLAEFTANAPQATVLDDAIHAISGVLDTIKTEAVKVEAEVKTETAKIESDVQADKNKKAKNKS
jgi:hypothetical protein